jgi:hypothetical protein
MVMELSDILHELDRNRGYFPRQAVEEALRRQEEITPHLLSALEEAAVHADTQEEEDLPFLPIYALYMLAQFREKRAYPLVIKLCKLPGQGLYDLIGDTVTEGLPSVIASVYDGEMAPLASIIEDSTLDEYVRSAPLRTLSILTREGILPRADVIAYQKELFRGKLERDESHVWNALASEAVDIYAKELADDIRNAYENGFVWPGFMSFREVEEIFSRPQDVALARAGRYQRGLIDDVVAEMHWWACFEPRSRPRSKTKRKKPSVPSGRHNSGAVARSEPKVGRNDPCPCGGGKKYKKCCGAG